MGAGDLLPAPGPAGEPDLDLVARLAVPHLRAVLVEVEVVLTAVRLSALPVPQCLVARTAAVDAVLEFLVPDRLADDDRDLLVRAPGVRRRERGRGEVGGAQTDRGGRLVGVHGGLGDGERERDVLGELLLDQLLVVGEVEDGLAVLALPGVVRVEVRRGLTGRHLRGEHGHPVDVRRVAVRLAVGGVQLRGDLRVVARDGGVAGGAGERLVEDVVGGRGRHLPADAVEEEFGGGVVVDAVPEADALLEGVEGLGLGLGAGARAAVGLTGGVGGRTLVVVAPLVGEVAVEVDAVARADDTVAVDVPQVLAPEAGAGVLEGVVVAVRVGREDEPQFGRVDDLLDAPVGRVAVQVVVHQTPGHLRRDPLARVLVGHVQHRGPGAVLRLLRVPGQFEREDVLAAQGSADGLDLGEAGVGLGGPEDLLLEPAASAVRAEHALGGVLDPGFRLGRQGVLGEVDALLAQLRGLLAGEVDLDLGPAASAHPLTEFMAVLAGLEQQGYLLPGDLGAVDLDLVRIGRRRTSVLCLGDGCEARSADQKRADSEDRSRSVSHEPP